MSLNLVRSAWKRVALGDVAQASKEKCDPTDGSVERYVAGEHMDTNDLRISRWGNVGDGYLGPAFHRRFRPGDVLYGSRRTYLRKVAVADFDGVCANTTFVVQTRDACVLLPDFLPWIMTSESFHAFAIGESKGSVNPYVNWSDIERYEFDLPSPPEQARLSNLFWRIERHRQALVHRRNRALALTARAVDHLLWESVPSRDVVLGDVLGIVRGGSPRPINDYFTDSSDGLNWIKIGDVPPDGKYITETAQRIRPEGLSKTRTVAPGDLLLSNSMSFGRPYIVQIDGCIHDGWLALTDKSGSWRTEYLYYLLRSEQAQRQFEQAAGGSTVRNLNTASVAKVHVPLPTLAAQDEVLARVMDLEAMSSACAEEEARVSALAEGLFAEVMEAHGAI